MLSYGQVNVMTENFVITIWLKMRKDSTKSIERGERISIHVEKHTALKVYLERHKTIYTT